MPLPKLGNVPASPIGRHVSEAQRAFFRAIPKVELHCHLLGSVRHATFVALAAKHDAPVTRDEIDSFYQREGRPVGVLHILRTLERHILLDTSDFFRITYEYLEDAAAEGVRHAEFFWNPTATIRDTPLAYPDLQEAIVAAMAAAEHDLGITALLIPSIDREADPADAVTMVREIIAHRHPAVVGIGIDYRETDRPPELFVDAYALARQHGLRTTAHAGEFGMPWSNVRTAVERLHVDRVDHGYTIVDNPDLASKYTARGLIFTVVPTNSYYLRTLDHDRWALDHPIRRMAALGIRIHPNSDDPTLHNVTASGAWELMYSHLGFTIAELREMMLNGIDGSWADPEAKMGWADAWPAEFDALAGAANRG